MKSKAYLVVCRTPAKRRKQDVCAAAGSEKKPFPIGEKAFVRQSLRFSGVFISFALKRAVPISVVNIVDMTISNSALIPTAVIMKSSMLLPLLSLSI